MKLHRSLVSLALFTAALPFASRALDPFQSQITVDANAPQTRGFVKIEDLVAQFSNANLATLAPTYTPVSAVSAAVNLRGLQGVVFSYSAGSATLNLSIPAIGLNQNFAGATRDASQDLLKEFFKGAQGQQAVQDLLTKLAEVSPIDPLAGNPNSLMAQMTAADFANALNGIAANLTGAAKAAGESAQNFFGVSARFGQYKQGPFEATALTLPLNYTHLFTNGNALILDLPLTYVDNNGAKSGNLSFGAGYRVGVTDRWDLTPAVRAGATGSADLGSAGAIYSGGVTSVLRLNDFTRPVDFSLANMVGYYKATSLKVGDYNVGYDLQNLVLRNGLLIGGELSKSATLPFTWEYQVVRTDFTGDALYSDYYYDTSVSIGTRKRQGATVWNALRAGVTYTTGAGDVEGISGNLGYTF